MTNSATQHNRFLWRAKTLIVLITLAPLLSSAADWPTWRHDPSRGGSSPHTIPTDLHLQWKRTLTPNTPAWPDTQPTLRYDVASHPIVMGHQVFVASSTTDQLTAYDTRTGKENWHFNAEAPIRLAPVAHKGKVYVTADDGRLTCLDATTGKQLWRHDGAPSQRLILGNRRLISSWPSRGGPVLQNGVIYYTASIWPLMGIFIHAVDAETGKTIWTNSGEGSTWTVHPHGAPSFAGVAPQGHLAISGDALIVPGGRSTPAVYDLKTGKLRFFTYAKSGGGHAVMADAHAYHVGGSSFTIEDGKGIKDGHKPVILTQQEMITRGDGHIRRIAAQPVVTEKKSVDKRGKETVKKTRAYTILDDHEISSKAMPKIRAGNLLIGTSSRTCAILDPSQKENPRWSHDFPRSIWEVIAADDRLFVVTHDNHLYCFGADKQAPLTHPLTQTKLAVSPKADTLSKQWVSEVEGAEGVALIFGLNAGDLPAAIIKNSNFHVIVVDEDPKKTNPFRETMIAADLYGKRVAAITARPDNQLLPEYMCHLILVQNKSMFDGDMIDIVFKSLRPYGGRALVRLSDTEHAALAARISKNALPGAALSRKNGITRLIRKGALPGSADWTHQYADAGQSVVSQDTLIKAPMGLLWFGGASHSGILPRHGHGPSPQVAGGRLVIEGPDLLRSVDVYTGRVCWEREIKGLGSYYNNTAHVPGAGEVGSNYVTLEDAVYAVLHNRILKLNARTGETELEITHPDGDANFGFLAVAGDTLITTRSPVVLPKESSRKSPKNKMPATTEQHIIPPHAIWSYTAGTDPEDSWTQLSTDVSKWLTGKAGFGYGDKDDATILDMKNKFTRVYIRHTFDSSKLTDAAELGLKIRYDDGFIAYLNGTEIARGHMASGRGKTAKVRQTAEATVAYDTIDIKDWKRLLLKGQNVLAIEGHNAGLGSSDFTLDPYLVAHGKPVKPTAPTKVTPSAPPVSLAKFLVPTRHSSASRELRAYDRHTGKLLWTRHADTNFRHNNIALTDTTLFCIDSLSEAKRKQVERRGITATHTPTLLALDLTTGTVRWKKEEGVFGTFLSYSREHDILLQAGSKGRDRARDESGTGMTAYRGKDGTQLWANSTSYGGPCLLWKNRILTNGSGGNALDIQTGKALPWKWSRHYGCNTAIASQNLLTFRSGAAGFYDLENDSGTANFGGFKSSCTANLIPANGVLNAPDYTRTCRCSYQNQTSLALVHMPQAELWAFGAEPSMGRLGVNFGAPGDRRSAEKTLWLDYPSEGGNSADTKVTVTGKPVYARNHSSSISGELPWVASSYATGIDSLSLPVDKPGTYTVRLCFAEPETLAVGDRVFDIQIQDKVVTKAFDLTAQTKEARTSFIQTYTGIQADKAITVSFTKNSTHPPIISGLELIKE